MTNADLARIEEELGLTLPEAYRGAVVPSPIPAEAGNAEGELWDDAEALIDENRRLRAERGWPSHLFLVGNSGTAQYAIDVREADPPVWYIEHGDWTSKHSGATGERFSAWAAEYIAEASSG